MIKIGDTGLLEGLPPGIAEQHWVKVIDAVYRERLKKELKVIERIHVYTAIDSLPEDLLNVLAVQFKGIGMITRWKQNAGSSRRPWRCGGTAELNGR